MLGDQAPARERAAECGVGAGKAHVAVQREHQPQPRCRAIDGRDHGLAHGRKVAVARLVVGAPVHVERAHPLGGADIARRQHFELVDVHAGAEALAGPGQHHHAHVVVAIDGLHGVAQLGLHDLGQRIELVRPVQGDHGDPLALPRASNGNLTVHIATPFDVVIREAERLSAPGTPRAHTPRLPAPHRTCRSRRTVRRD
ncbi:hypothetical protein D3C87_1043410 [compost metagenome]